MLILFCIYEAIFYVYLYLASSDIEYEEQDQPPSKRLKKPAHNILPLEESQLKMDWTMVRVHGAGLINKYGPKKCLNICYINSIIQ